MATRMGKHREGKSSIGLYVDDDFRALLTLLVDKTGNTATEILMEGVRVRATSLGIMKEGEIVPEYKPAIEIIKEAFRAKRENRKEGK